MCASWSALYISHLSICQRKSAECLFAQMWQRQAVLADTRSIEALLLRQHDLTSPSAIRQAVVRVLATEAQALSPEAELAATILILVLWPGLDCIYRRLRTQWPHHRDEIAGDILSQVSIGMRSIDLMVVEKVAATLVRNAERDLSRLYLRTSRYHGLLSVSEVELDSLAAPMPDQQEIEPAEWRERMMPLLGRDTELFLRIMMLGETQAEAGKALGLSHDQVRKRHQRAMQKLTALQDNSASLSHSAPPIGL